MSRNVYSVSFVQAAAVEGEERITVPDGHVYVLRDIDAWCDQVAGGYEIAFIGYSGQVFFAAAGSATIADNNAQWRGRLVFTPGQTFGCNVVSGSWGVAMGGYDLTLP